MTKTAQSKNNSDLISGLLLLFTTVLALIFANQSVLASVYSELKNTIFTIGFTDSGLILSKPLLLWINDGLMAIFFLLVGLELKREILIGQFADLRKIALPGIAALGGIIVPALIYMGFNFDDPVSYKGWAIPIATDIAFVMGILALLSKHVPSSLRIFLIALAIFDDLAAILIIAIFYTHDLSWLNLLLTLFCLLILISFNLFKVTRLVSYMLVGIVMWVCLLKSGVHATLAGVLLGFTIPFKPQEQSSPLIYLEHGLMPWVYFGVLPIFAFVNAGINLQATNLAQILSPVTLGISLGLFIGKPVGVFVFAWAAIRSGFASLPERISWLQFLGAAILCGVGFTMSLFIASLSFDTLELLGWDNDRLGILIGSLSSGIVGYILLRFTKS